MVTNILKKSTLHVTAAISLQVATTASTALQKISAIRESEYTESILLIMCHE